MDLKDFLKRISASTQHQRFYHFTDRRNLESIRKHGLLSTAELKRRDLFGSVVPGGDANSQASDHASGTSHYVCLCFTQNHPMCHVARNDDRKLDPVYLQIEPGIIQAPGVMITNAPSNQNGIQKVPAVRALDILDLDVIYTRMDWKDPAIRARLLIAEKYEILVPREVAREYILHGL
jgi:hypothetical protein